ADYLAVRRALGYKLADHGRLLTDFATFLEDHDAGTITTELALAWATRPGNALPSWWAARLRVVRGFARHVKAFDPATEIPPSGPSLLISTAGTRLIRQNVEYVFARLVRSAGLGARSDVCRPRLHDFRHSLAVHTLLGWYRDGLDVQARLPLLSTLLGHTNPA